MRFIEVVPVIIGGLVSVGLALWICFANSERGTKVILAFALVSILAITWHYADSEHVFTYDPDYNVRGTVEYMQHSTVGNAVDPGGWARIRTAVGKTFYIRTDREAYYNRITPGDFVDLSTMGKVKLKGWSLGKKRDSE